MANDVKIILTAVDKASGVLKGTTSNVKGMLTAIGAVSGVAIAAGTAIKKIADETVAYNKSIRELTQVTGTGAEEISRIVQVADDWGIEIGQVRSALVLMNKNGMAPTIDNLAQLADEYANTTDKTQFAEKANKLFGRQYATLIPLFAKGGKALRDQAAAIDKNLIATDDSIAAAREYEKALDDWNDSVQGLSMTIGNVLLPELARMLNDINSLNEANTRMVAGSDVAAARMRALRNEVATLDKPLDSAGQSYQSMAEKFKGQAFDELGADAEAAAEKLNLIPVALDEIDKASIASTQVSAVNEAFKNGTITATEYDELMRKIGIKYTDLSAQEINQQILLANLTRSYEAGNITLKEYLATIDYMTAAWGKVPKDVTTTYHIKYDKAPYGAEPGPGVPVPGTPGWGDGSGNNGGPRAAGGPVMAGQAYTVGERGPEMFVPNQSGTIIPNNQMGGTNINIAIYPTPGMNEEDVGNIVAQKLSIMYRNMRAGGYARGA